jgi:hypothetical protein
VRSVPGTLTAEEATKLADTVRELRKRYRDGEIAAYRERFERLAEIRGEVSTELPRGAPDRAQAEASLKSGSPSKRPRRKRGLLGANGLQVLLGRDCTVPPE